MRSRIVLTLAALTATAAASPALAAPGQTTLMSTAGTEGAAGTTLNPALSADGTRVAFATVADNLLGFDGDGTTDVFVRDRLGADLRLATAIPHPVPGFAPIAQNGDAEAASDISADGRYVAFASNATNLSGDDEDATIDIFRKDLLTGTVELVSRADGANGAAADADAIRPTISDDGTRVAFDSIATNLDGADEDAVRDVFVRDLATEQTLLMSTGGIAGDDDSVRAAISGDGTRVAFISEATNFTPLDEDARDDVFRKTIGSPGLAYVSRASDADGGAGQNLDAGGSGAVAIDGDGSHVAFTSSATNLGDGGPALDIYVRDVAAQTTTLVSRASGAAGAPPTQSSFAPSLSADGRRVAFHSGAPDLHPDDTDIDADVYVRDLDTHETILASRATDPAPGTLGPKSNGSSLVPSLNADGSLVAFTSTATNFGGHTGYEVYVRDLAPNPAPPQPPVAGEPPAGPAPTPTPGAGTTGPQTTTTTKKPAVRIGTLRLRTGSSTCVRRNRVVLRLGLKGATRGVLITGTTVRVGRRTQRSAGAAARIVIVRGLSQRRASTLRVRARTSASGRAVTRTLRFLPCR